jgi:hypothetical protein
MTGGNLHGAFLFWALISVRKSMVGIIAGIIFGWEVNPSHRLYLSVIGDPLKVTRGE